MLPQRVSPQRYTVSAFRRLNVLQAQRFAGSTFCRRYFIVNVLLVNVLLVNVLLVNVLLVNVLLVNVPSQRLSLNLESTSCS